MPDEPAKRPIETPKAAQVFLDYVELGEKRSIEKLAIIYVQRNRYKTVATAKTTIQGWSTKYRWQDRIASVASEEADRLLREAAILDASTFAQSSKHLNKAMTNANPAQIDAIIRVRESVRKPMPKGTADISIGVSVSITIEQRKMAEQIARQRGLDVEDVLAEVDQLLGTKS